MGVWREPGVESVRGNDGYLTVNALLHDTTQQLLDTDFSNVGRIARSGICGRRAMCLRCSCAVWVTTMTCPGEMRGIIWAAGNQN